MLILILILIFQTISKDLYRYLTHDCLLVQCYDFGGVGELFAKHINKM